MQAYAAMFANIAPQLNAHLQQQIQVIQPQPLHQPNFLSAVQSQPRSEEQVNGTFCSQTNSLEPASTSTDPSVGNISSRSERLLVPPQEKQWEDQNEHKEEDTCSSATSEKVQDQKEAQAAIEIPQTESQLLTSFPSSSSSPLRPAVDTLPLPRGEHHHLVSSPPSASIPSPLLPYHVPPYLHLPHTPHPIQPYSWMQYHYQQTPNASSPSSPLHHHHYYPSMFSPVIFPPSPNAPPFSPSGVGIMSSHLLHQPYGFSANGLPSSGLSSAGSGSPDLTGSPGFSMNSRQRSRMKRRKLQMANINSNENMKAGDDDAVAGLSVPSTVPAQPSTVAEIGKKPEADESAMVDAEAEGDDATNANSLYSGFLADAILKRPGSLRPPSASVPRKNNKKGSRSVERQQHPKSSDEELTEFTFPSLSDFGNVYYRTSSRTESSISSSLSSSPPSTTATVPDTVGDLKPEEDKISLPPLIEKSEDSDQSSVDVLGQAEVKETVHDVQESPTPRKEDQKSSLTSAMEQS